MRSIFKTLASLALLLAIAGCATDTYPVSGDQCGPNDSVQTLDNIDCAPVVSGGM